MSDISVINSVSPEFTKTPDRDIKVTANSLASISCQAFGFPSPTIVWSRGLVPLPQGRVTVINGTLNIFNFSLQDVGPYQCKATNKLGSVTTLTTLHYVNKGKNQLWIKASRPLHFSPHGFLSPQNAATYINKAIYKSGLLTDDLVLFSPGDN